jgi:FAD/FMN-containing dehydrogenase
MAARSMVQDALVIDLRKVAYVSISPSKTTAKIGGGTLMTKVGAELTEACLATALGNTSRVGYVGWAVYGGYGPFNALYGLGLDNIVGATVVDVEGVVMEADAELLKGIRGAGGTLGIIVEVEVKVYPLKEVSYVSVVLKGES